MVLDRHLHAQFLNQGNGRLKLIVAVHHLGHNLGMHPGAVQFPGPENIQTEFHQFRSQLVADLQGFFHRAVYPGIAARVEGRVELQKQSVFPGGLSHLPQVLRREGSIAAGGQQVHFGDLQAVQSPLLSLIHQFVQRHHLIEIVIFSKTPAFSKAEKVQGIGMHPQSQGSVFVRHNCSLLFTFVRALFKNVNMFTF